MGGNRLALFNMFFLFVRMIITMGINLFSSRIILKALGVSDYGLYNVVAGMVIIISFLHYALNGATVRFINIEFAKNDLKQLKELFNNLFFIHIILGVLIVLIGEPIGLYLIYNYLNIPENRFIAAQFVLHFSIASMFLNVIQVPYDSTIIAHQKMSILAYVSILESVMKLLASFVVLYSNFDKLINYAFFLFCISLITRFIYQLYCKINYKETKLDFTVKFDKGLLKEISIYFGWDLLGNISALLRIQGINILQNIFFGTIVNAAMGIASTIANAISSLVANINFALKPQIFQYYSNEKKDKCFYLVDIGTRLSFCLLLLICTPFIFQTKFFLNFWLENVPNYSENFTKLMIVAILLGTLFDYFVVVINANGKIKNLSILGTVIYGGSFLVSLALLKLGFGKYTVSIIHIITTILMGIGNTFILLRLEPTFRFKEFFINVFLRCSLVTFIAFISCYFVLQIFNINVIYLIIVELLITSLIIFIVGTNYSEKIQLFNLIKQRIN